MAASLFANWETEIDSQIDRPKFNTLSTAERNALVMSIQKIARGEAIRHAKNIGRPNEIDDFEGVATVAIVEASRTYDPTRGTQFGTWATAYIRRCLLRETTLLEPAVGLSSWDAVADDEEQSTSSLTTRTPNAEQYLLLSKLSPQAREIVRLTVFDRMTPDQVADQLHMAVKDVKLAIRNAGKTLSAFIAADESPENIFGDIYEEATPAGAA